MIGGHTNSSNDKRDSDTAESYDPFTNEWNVVAKLNTPRHRLGVAVLDGMIYAVGGSDGMIHLNSIERYDIETDTWTTLPNMVTRRMGKTTSTFLKKKLVKTSYLRTLVVVTIVMAEHFS